MSDDEVSVQAMPGFMVRRLHQLHDSLWEKELGSSFTPPQFGVLATLAARPGVHQQKLCSLVALDSSTGADVVNRLLGAGLLRRRRDEHDRRRYLLELTAQGRALLADVEPAVRDINERLVRSLSPPERTAFLAQIDRILAGEPDR